MCFIERQALKTFQEVDVQLHAVLTSALDGDKWSVSCSGHFISSKTSPSASLDKVEMRTSSCPVKNPNLSHVAYSIEQLSYRGAL